jgi:hypothetical protein
MKKIDLKNTFILFLIRIILNFIELIIAFFFFYLN